TSQVINFNEQLFLIDCGEGTQMQLFRYGVKSNRINHIFISHLHGDHYLGLVGLLSSLHLMGRKADLHLYGPPALEEIIEIQFKHSATVLNYNLLFHPTNPNKPEVIFAAPALKVTSFPLKHRIPCTGFRFDEGKRAATLNAEAVERLNIPTPYLRLLKKGIDYADADGKLYRAEDLTYPAPKSRSYAYCSDTMVFDDYLSNIQNVDLLYHEATFMHDMLDRAKDTFHTTAQQAGEVAKQVGAQKLLLGH